MLKISMATVFGLLFGAAIGLIGMGGANVSFSPQVVGMLGRYAWWIVFLSMLVPLADYLSGVRTTLTGVLTGHPFRHVAGFFPCTRLGAPSRTWLSARCSWLACFERIFSATSDFREVKKTKGFYQRICQILGTRPQEIVHVGDHYEFDYVVPRSLGIHAFYLDRSGERKGEFIIPDLRDLEKILPAEGERSGDDGVSP